jgi:multidrug efflux pump subunit AcrB
LLRVPDVAKVELFGVQPRRSSSRSRRSAGAAGLDLNQVIAQLGAQNAVEGAGVLNAGSENLQVRVGGQFNSVEELQRFRSARQHATGQASTLRLATSPTSGATTSTRRR